MKTAILTSFATLIVTGSVMTSVEEEGPVSFAPAVFMAWGPAESQSSTTSSPPAAHGDRQRPALADDDDEALAARDGCVDEVRSQHCVVLHSERNDRRRGRNHSRSARFCRREEHTSCSSG